MGAFAGERGLAQGVASAFRNVGFTLGPAIFSFGAYAGGFILGFFGVAVFAAPASLLLMFLRRGADRPEPKHNDH